MAFNWLLALRATQCLLSIIVLGLSAYVANWYNMGSSKSPSQVNLLVAAPVLSMASLAYSELMPRFAKKLYSPYVALAADAINAVVYFAGFIALAVFLSSLLFCHGTVCGSARADSVLAAGSWVAWTASAVLTALDVFDLGALWPSARQMRVAEMEQTA